MGIRQRDVTPECWAALQAAAAAADRVAPVQQAQVASKTKKSAPGPTVEPSCLVGPAWIEWTIPLKIESPLNGTHFKTWLIGQSAKHRRGVGMALATQLFKMAWFRKVIDDGGTLVCTITRLGVRMMDDDNLPPTGKHVRDTVALFLGVDDKPGGPIAWKYEQRTGDRWGVRVRIEEVPTP